MIFVYVPKSADRIREAIDWLNTFVGPETPHTWFRVSVDNCDPFRMGNKDYRHLRYSWVICDHELATMFKLKFQDSYAAPTLI